VRVADGGTGFVVGDTLIFNTPSPGTDSTYLVPVYLTVISAPGGVINSVAIATPGRYAVNSGVLPSNPAMPTTPVVGGAQFNFTWSRAQARPSFRINQRRGSIDGRSFYQSIFGFMTPFILALSRKGS
jgi:hypothetical protein